MLFVADNLSHEERIKTLTLDLPFLCAMSTNPLAPGKAVRARKDLTYWIYKDGRNVETVYKKISTYAGQDKHLPNPLGTQQHP